MCGIDVRRRICLVTIQKAKNEELVGDKSTHEIFAEYKERNPTPSHLHATLVADGVKAGEPCRRAVQTCGSSVANIRLPYGKVEAEAVCLKTACFCQHSPMSLFMAVLM